MKRVAAFLMWTIATFLTGCSSLPHEPSAADSTAVYVWPLPQCPSQADESGKVLGPLLGGALIGDAVSGLIGAATSALSAAAQADKTGLSVAGTSARFFYQGTVAYKAGAATLTVDSVTLTNPGCYAVAYAKPDLRPAASHQSWCDDATFAKSVPNSCRTEGKKILDGLTDKEKFVSSAVGRKLETPKLYAEIAFEDSGYLTGSAEIVRPRVLVMHYPQSIISPLSTKARHVTLSLTIASPATDTFKNSSVAIEIFGLKPATPVDADTLAIAQTAWTTMPITKAKPTDWPTNYGKTGGFMPVNITAQLHEVGDPNVFLAAFAASFQSGAGSLSTGITNLLTPSGQAAAKQTEYTNSANQEAAYATVLSSQAALTTACNTFAALPAAQKTPAAIAAADQAYYNALSAVDKFNAAREVATNPLPAASPPAKCPGT